MNHHPTKPSLTWPQVEHGDYFVASRNPAAHAKYRAGFVCASAGFQCVRLGVQPVGIPGLCRFQLLADLGLSYDLQLNPHQMLEAAAFLADFPAVPVIINHLGCPKCVHLVH